MVTKQDSGFQLEGNAAALYEAHKVPSLFAPLADATIDAITISKNDTIIQLSIDKTKSIDSLKIKNKPLPPPPRYRQFATSGVGFSYKQS